jgi:hypothetical protein
MPVIEFPAGTAPADIRVFAAGPAPAVAEAQREERRIQEGEDRDQEGEVQPD